MAKDYFLPNGDLERLEWLKNFAAKLPAYAGKYSIAAGEVTDMQDSSVYFGYWMDARRQAEEGLRKLVQFKNELIGGVPAGATASVTPEPNDFKDIPTGVEPGIFKRAVSIAKIIKSKTNNTLADNKDLGIEGPDIAADLDLMKPELKLVLVAGGRPEVKWKKKGMDGIEIYVDRGKGQFELLAFDTHPDYMDTAPLPAAGASAIWSYKAIYRFGDGPVGIWSDPVSITVTGS